MQTDRLRLKIYFTIFFAVLITGTTGIMFAEKLDLVDALYFSIVTIATVGYGDIAPHTPLGKGVAILLIVGGVSTFVGAMASATELFLSRRESQQRRTKLQMVIGLFYSEAGTRLLRTMTSHDPALHQVGTAIIARGDWQQSDYQKATLTLAKHPFKVDMEQIDLEELRDFLNKQGNLMIRLMESPYMLEHEALTDLLLALMHLKEELLHRPGFTTLPATDVTHLQGDIERVYRQLAAQWFAYMAHLQQEYPFLFSLGLRTNPFNPEASSIVLG